MDVEARAEFLRSRDAQFRNWASGYGMIEHEDRTQTRINDFLEKRSDYGVKKSREEILDYLIHIDRITNASMWLVVHMTYANTVYLEQKPLKFDEFKENPQGHTGGSLNMVPAYLGYLAANGITNETRSWIMGQGHCVAAIDAVNVIIDNMTSEHKNRYGISSDELTRMVQDFYSYDVRPSGEPESPLGSHVNIHTAGGIAEGGYLGFTELQYSHMPRPDEKLVAFLSDGAFEEQRGSDWVSRWWRHTDTGPVIPVMIKNQRRIDQRTNISQMGGTSWLEGHLEQNYFNPLVVDGHDPAAVAWSILRQENTLSQKVAEVKNGNSDYPLEHPYVIARSIKGYGFPGGGTNEAHNLPLSGNPSKNQKARNEFNEGTKNLHVPTEELKSAIVRFQSMYEDRPRECNHPLANREVTLPDIPEPPWHDKKEASQSPMKSIDQYFVEIIKSNPGYRVRVGNPDEMRSNRLGQTLEFLKHRVTDPEPPLPESTDGSVITALNEEAVVCAALGNRGGINLVHTYEAFGVKMLGAIRQELIFSRDQSSHGQSPGWLSLPLFLTSHTWENGKNEHSHQDTTLCEALLSEMSDHSRVLFPADSNTILPNLRQAYKTKGKIFTIVAPKGKVPVQFSRKEASELQKRGAIAVRKDKHPELLLVATGAYQLNEILKASGRLKDSSVSHSVIYLQEPGRFRSPRDEMEANYTAARDVRESIFPSRIQSRVFLSHTRPEPLRGILKPLVTAKTSILGYQNKGGTLDLFGMLYSNSSTWAHVIQEVANQTSFETERLLTEEERASVRGLNTPDILRSKEIK